MKPVLKSTAAALAAPFLLAALAGCAPDLPARTTVDDYLVEGLCPELYPVQVNGQILSLPYCTTWPIDQPNAAIERIVFSIHGVSTNASSYFNGMVRAADRVPGALDRTLIIAPKLMTRAFAESNDLGPTAVFWNTSSQRFWGGESGSSEQLPREASVSSFEIMDRFLTDLTAPGLFPNLQMIVLAGHSGGGQFVNRYAMSNVFEGDPDRQRGVHVRYLAAQPSTHAYLNDERVDPTSRTRTAFEAPSSDRIAECPSYDRYGSGLEALEQWPYLAAVGAERMRRQYRDREVVYLHGMNDNDPQGSSLARGCAAMMQGAHRLERGITYFNFIEHFYAEGGHNHRIAFVPRVAHNQAGMWASDPGLLHIFDYAVTIAEGGAR